MSTKITLQVLIILTCLTLFISSASATIVSDTPRISVTLVDQTPDPVEPGQIVDVKFKIENEGAQTDHDVLIRLLPKYPFTIYGDQVEKNVGKLAAGSVNNEAIYVEYKLKVDEKAVEQDTEIELEVVQGEGIISYTSDEFKLKIQTHDASLDIKAISLDPNPIPPGETGKISLTVKNLADSLLKDVRLKLDFTSSDLPIAPFQSSSERILAQIESGYEDTLVFEIIAKPDAIPGLYKIPLNITFSDEQGSRTTINDILAIQIGDEPNLKPFLKKSSTLGAGAPAKVTLALANAGPTDIKFLEFTLQPDSSYTSLTSTNYYYIGDVDSDDTESEELDLFITKDTTTLSLPIKLNFIDANNKPYEIYTTLKMPLLSEDKLKEYGLVTRSNTAIIIILIVLAAVGFYIYRRHKKKKVKKD